MKSPLISLIVPSWQSGEYLEQTLLSVLAQNYEYVELILVDNESTDQTKEIIDIYRDHFTHIIVEPDRGQSDAINKGMALATGEILGWLNADDILLEGCLSRVAQAFEQQKPDILTTDTIDIDENNRIMKFSLQPKQRPFFYHRGIMFLTAPSIFFSRQAFRGVVGGVSKDLRLSMDVDLCYAIIANGGKVHHMRGYCGAFRRHIGSKTSIDLFGRSTRENSETRMVFQRFQISERTRNLAHRLHQIRLVLELYPLRRRLDAARYLGKFGDFLREIERNRRVTPQQDG